MMKVRIRGRGNLQDQFRLYDDRRSRANNNGRQQSLEACGVIQLDVIQKDNKKYVHGLRIF